MRILVDYRPALRERTGVGEYIHELIRAYAAAYPGEMVALTASWKDRPARGLGSELGVPVVDRRIPVRALNYVWHRAEWPPVEALAGPADIVHAAHPLLIPARQAAQVVTVHDLFFLSHPETTVAEIRRDYASLAASHGRRAHAVVTSTAHGKRLIVEQLGVEPDHVYVCSPGAPRWQSLGEVPHRPTDGYVLFVGTLEPRKNVGALLDAWEMVIAGTSTGAMLVLAGRPTAAAQPWLDRLERPPLAGRVKHLGYVPASERERLYAGASALVIPSLDEGFGLPALEAMSAGIPVLASNRGALPEVLGNAGVLVEPTDVQGIARELERLLTDPRRATELGAAGLRRAAEFTWARTADTLRTAYVDAVARRRDEARIDGARAG